MRISELEKREDLWVIIINTIENIKKRRNLSNLIFKEGNNHQILIAQSYINFIAPPFLKSKALLNLKSEYLKGHHRWLKTLQYIYVYLSTIQLLRFLFIRRFFTINAKLRTNIYIIPGNHRLRFLDMNYKHMYVVLKHNENHNFIENEIKLRNITEIYYAPKFLAFGHNWFKEEFVVGTPINRISNKGRIEKIKSDLISRHHSLLVIPNLTYIEFSSYLSKIVNQIESIIESLPSKKQLIVRNYFPLELLSQIQGRLTNINYMIPTSITHGDFQVSNILVNQTNVVKVIDWENVSSRFCYYDEFVLYSGVRQSSNYNVRSLLDKYFQNHIINKKSTLIKTTHSKLFSKNLFFISLIMEELLFIINDQISKNYLIFSNKPKILINCLFSFVSSKH